MKKILLLHGPNLNTLGRRETAIYGSLTLAEINQLIQVKADELGVALDIRQSNHEGQLLDWLSESAREFDGLVINPAALTHTSVSLRDAIVASGLPAIEVHISNLFKRETFRHHSFVSAVCVGIIAGLGHYGYVVAVQSLVEHLSHKQS